MGSTPTGAADCVGLAADCEAPAAPSEAWQAPAWHAPWGWPSRRRHPRLERVCEVSQPVGRVAKDGENRVVGRFIGSAAALFWSPGRPVARWGHLAEAPGGDGRSQVMRVRDLSVRVKLQEPFEFSSAVHMMVLPSLEALQRLSVRARARYLV